MKPHDIFGIFFILILVFLLVNNAKGSSQVISALSGAVTNTTSVLQGRDIQA